MKIAIICNYVLKPNRIGGMDRFYKLFDAKCKVNGFELDWYFSNYQEYDFYKELSIISSEGKQVEQRFIETSNGKNYDIIITHFTQLCTQYYKEFKRLHPNSKIITVDHNARPINGFPYKKRLKKKIQGLKYGKFIDKFVGVSNYSKSHIIKDYGKFVAKKTSVIYNGINTSIFKKRVDINSNKFIIVAHLTYNKGIQDVLKALTLIDTELVNKVKIDIYGEGIFGAKLKQLTKDFNLEKTVNFKGSSSNLPNLFSEYSYMILPTYMECFSLSILESLSANVPVVTTTVGGNLEVLEDGVNSFIFKPKDVEKLASILTAIIAEKKSITIDVSKKVKEEFYLDKMVDEHIKLITCT